MGLPVRADPQNIITPAAELTAVLAGRLTFDVLTLGLPPRIYLEWRSPDRIAAGRNHPVVAQHHCPKE